MPISTGKPLTTSITDQMQERLQATLPKAEKSVDDEAVIVLTRRESLRLLELLENPPPRNAKFLQAQERYQKVKADAGSAAAR